MALSCKRRMESLLLETENVARQAWVRRSTTSSGSRVLPSREAARGSRLHTPSLMASAAAPPELQDEEDQPDEPSFMRHSGGAQVTA